MLQKLSTGRVFRHLPHGAPVLVFLALLVTQEQNLGATARGAWCRALLQEVQHAAPRDASTNSCHCLQVSNLGLVFLMPPLNNFNYGNLPRFWVFGCCQNMQFIAFPGVGVSEHCELQQSVAAENATNQKRGRGARGSSLPLLASIFLKPACTRWDAGGGWVRVVGWGAQNLVLHSDGGGF